MEEMREPEQDEAEESYELDLERDSAAELDEVFEEAVAAVEGDSDEAGHNAPKAAARIEELKKELAEAKDRQVRILADFDNFRKRSEREKDSLRRYALQEPMRSFVEVVDNIDRALAASGSAEDLKLGLEMIVRQLQEMLHRYGVQSVESVGKPFDPAVHEAVSRLEDEEVEVPTVSAEMQKGYMLHDRLLRPAMVTVAMPVKVADRKVSSDAEEGEPVGEEARAEASD